MERIVYSIKDDGKLDFCMEGKAKPQPSHTVYKHEIKMYHRHKYKGYIKKLLEENTEKIIFETHQ